MYLQQLLEMRHKSYAAFIFMTVFCLSGYAQVTNLEDSGANVQNSSSGTGYFEWEDLRMNEDTLFSVSTNSDIVLSPNGSGSVIAVGGGSNSTLIGNNSTSSGNSSVAIGDNAQASGLEAVAIGNDPVASASSAVAIGDGAEAEANSAIAIGNDAGDTSGTKNGGSISMGDNSNSSTEDIGQNSVAIGVVSMSSGKGAIAIGSRSKASAQGAILIGYKSSGEHNNSLSDSFELAWDGITGFKVGNSYGTGITVNADPDNQLTDAVDGVLAYDSTDDEFRAKINGSWRSFNLFGSGGNATAIGSSSTASGSAAIAIGTSSTASGSSSIAIGTSSQSTDTRGIALGYSANLTGFEAIAIGPYSRSSAISSISIGDGAEAEATVSIAIGDDAGDTSGTTNNASISLGSNSNSGTDNIGQNSIAIGSSTISSEKGTVAIGNMSKASAQGAIMMGYHTAEQDNTLSDSFELSWDGTTGFKVGNTYGTGITVNADPDTNLTNAVDGVIAYDSTDDEFRAKVNGSWTTLGGSGDVTKVGTPANNQLGVWTGDGTIEGEADLTFDGTSFMVTEPTALNVNEASDYGLTVFNDGNAATRWGAKIQTGEDSGSGTLIQFLDGDGTDVGEITFSGTTTTYGSSSDRRMKSNVKSSKMDVSWLYDILKDYQWKENGSKGTGVLAQELNEVFPYAVFAPNDGRMWSVDYGKLTIPLIRAYRLQEDKINALEQRLEEIAISQESLIASLRTEISALKSGEASHDQSDGSSVLFSRIELLQNKPNPFTAETRIEMNLPSAVKSAEVIIYDLKGTQLKKITVDSRGAATVSLQGSELETGMYIYALLADGELIDSKRMVLTD